MDIGKVIKLLALLFALLAGIVDIPGAAAVIAIAGLIAGFFVEEKLILPFLVLVLALAVVHGALTPIPNIGPYLTDMLASVSALFNASACAVIALELARRIRP